MINYFNKLTEDQDKKRMHSKSKAVEIFNKIKEGGNVYPSSFNPIQTPPPTFQQSQFPMYSQYHPPASNTYNGGQNYGKKKRIDPEKILAQTTAIN